VAIIQRYTKQWYSLLLVSGAVLLVGGVIQSITADTGTSGSTAALMVSSGVVLIVLSGARYLQVRRNGEEIRKDERTVKIGSYGLAYSWFLTFILLFLLFWLDYLGVFMPDTGTLLAVLVVVMGLSARLFQWHFFRRGDVE
jgi:uncharacterized membrane protein